MLENSLRHRVLSVFSFVLTFLLLTPTSFSIGKHIRMWVGGGWMSITIIESYENAHIKLIHFAKKTAIKEFPVQWHRLVIGLSNIFLIAKFYFYQPFLIAFYYFFYYILFGITLYFSIYRVFHKHGASNLLKCLNEYLKSNFCKTFLGTIKPFMGWFTVFCEFFFVAKKFCTEFLAQNFTFTKFDYFRQFLKTLSNF